MELPPPRADKQCCDCLRKLAITTDGRFCLDCLRKLVNKLTPIVGVLSNKKGHLGPNFHPCSDAAFENVVRLIEDNHAEVFSDRETAGGGS